MSMEEKAGRMDWMENVQTSAENAKAVICAAGALITSLFGWMGWLVVIYALAMALDYATGTIAAVKAHEWRSSTAREGIWHKTGCIVTVAAAALADWMLSLALSNLPLGEWKPGYTVLLCPLVLVWYIVTELGSVMENAEKLGAPVPGFLMRYMKKAQEKIEHKGGGAEK